MHPSELRKKKFTKILQHDARSTVKHISYRAARKMVIAQPNIDINQGCVEQRLEYTKHRLLEQ